MCQSSSESNERMESTENKHLVLNNQDHFGSSSLPPSNSEQGRRLQQDVSISRDVSFTNLTKALTSSDSSVSNYSDYSVDFNPNEGPSPEGVGLVSGHYGPSQNVNNSRLSTSENTLQQSDDVRDDWHKGNDAIVHAMLDLDGIDTDNDEIEGVILEDADESSPAYDDQYDIWLPPEAVDELDNVENSITALDDEEDECVNGDASEWAMPSSLNSFEDGIHGHRIKEDKEKAIEEVMNGKFKNLVSELLRKVGVENCDDKEESWVDTVTLLAWQAASFVKPEAAEGKAMDPAGYVKIKCLATGSRGDSRVIKGLVFKKHAAHKHMVTKYENPRLLLIQGGLEPSSASPGLSSFTSLMAEGKDNLTDLMENVKTCHPNVILVEKSASRDALHKVLDMGVTLVLDMKLHRLERVARCTGSSILSSDKPFTKKLKQCDSLYFEKVVEEHAIVGEGGKKPCKTLMYLKGCPTRLGCTILLKGSHNEELKKIKCVVQCAVVMAYHFLLETSFLVDQEAMFSTIAYQNVPDKENSISVSSEFSTISHMDVEVPISSGDDQGSSPLRESSVKIPSGSYDERVGESSHAVEIARKDCNESHMTTLSTASSSINDVLEKVSFVSPTTYEDMSPYFGKTQPQYQSAISIPVSSSKEKPENDDAEIKNSDINDVLPGDSLESVPSLSVATGEVKGVVDDGEDSIRPKDDISNLLDSESILVLMSSRNASKGTFCEQSHFSHIKFYRHFDVPLGKFLRDNLFKKTVSCKTCNESPEAHFYYYAHHSKQLTIKLKRIDGKLCLPGESEGKLWMWSRCGRCEPSTEKSTKRVLISRAARGLSFGKFLELSFSSHSSFNRLSSCGHSFQKDFLYFFGLGSMVAMFRYSRVATYTVSVPSQKLEFNCSINRDWLQKEIATVDKKGILLFTEVANYLKKLESEFSRHNFVLDGSLNGFADVVDMLKLERSEFEESIRNRGIRNENSHNTVHELLSLNWLRWIILLEACVWEQRLQSLISSLSSMPRSTVNNHVQKMLQGQTQELTDEPVREQIGTPNTNIEGTLSTVASSVDTETVLKENVSHVDHRSSDCTVLEVQIEEVERVEVPLEKIPTDGAILAEQGLICSPIIKKNLKSQTSGDTVTNAPLSSDLHSNGGVAQKIPNVGAISAEHGLISSPIMGKILKSQTSGYLVTSAPLSSDLHSNGGVTENNDEKIPNVGAISEGQGLISSPVIKKNLNSQTSGDIVTSAPLLPDLHSNGGVAEKSDDLPSDNLTKERNIPIQGDEENAVGEVCERVNSPPLSKSDSKAWVWNPFSDIREECMMDLHIGRLPKFGHLPKFTLLSSPDFSQTMSELILEEGSRLHIPLQDSDYIVSDFDGEVSSFVACALAVMKYLSPSRSSESNENATLKRAASEPPLIWAAGSFRDLDFIHSSTSVSFGDHFPNFDGLNKLDSLVGYGQIHPEVTLGVEKHTMKGNYSVVIIYENEFRLFREQCCPSELDYITSLSRCKIWDSKGGKSKSMFAKTLDDRLIIKEIQKTEFDSFMKFASGYFRYMKDSVKSGNQTCLAKILGIYQVSIRNPKSGRESKHDLMVMESISFGRNIARQYDLKGALHSRFTAGDGTDDVLLDQNFVNDMNASPLYVGQRAKRLLQRAVWNDTTFLHSINVMDYSLLVGVDTRRRELLCGIIDYLRQYTWDKQLETWVKSSLVMPKNVYPTIVSPETYKKRFRKFMDTHFLTVPDHWCSQRSSNPCKLCGVRSADSLQKMENGVQASE